MRYAWVDSPQQRLYTLENLVGIGGKRTTKIRIAFFADAHLGHSLKGYDQDGENIVEADVYRAWESAFTAIAHERPDAVLFGGDFFDSPTPPNMAIAHLLNQLNLFDAQMDFRSKREIVFVGVTGNHDVPKLESTGEFLNELHFNHIYAISGKSQFTIGGGIQVRSISHRNNADDFNRGLTEFGWDVTGKPLNIILTHGSLEGSFMMNEQNERILPASGEWMKGADLILAGHYHRPVHLPGMPGQPHFFYGGSLSPLNWGEAEYNHGWWLIDCERNDGDESWSIKAEFQEIKGRNWQRYKHDWLAIEEIGKYSIEKDSLCLVELTGVPRSENAQRIASDLKKRFVDAAHADVRVYYEDQSPVMDLGELGGTIETVYGRPLAERFAASLEEQAVPGDERIRFVENFEKRQEEAPS